MNAATYQRPACDPLEQQVDFDFVCDMLESYGYKFPNREDLVQVGIKFHAAANDDSVMAYIRSIAWIAGTQIEAVIS